MMKAVIIEDEESGRETLKNYLAQYCPDVKLVGMADSLLTGEELIKKTSPDIVFLDVEMPYGNGFDLLEKFDNISFEVVFVTAFSHYAIKALNLCASYYILKPVDIDELILAVNKIKEKRAKSDVEPSHTKVLIENLKSINKQTKKVILPVMEGFEIIHVNDIIRCEANDNFTSFHLTNGKKMLICRTLKFYEECLSDFDFVRVHKSHLINLQYVTKYTKGKGGFVTMNDGSQVDVSPNKRDEFIGRFQ
ncbi:MAG: LytR/AlgR family response regulator transcription factor [Flavobacteriales bacterium]